MRTGKCMALAFVVLMFSGTLAAWAQFGQTPPSAGQLPQQDNAVAFVNQDSITQAELEVALQPHLQGNKDAQSVQKLREQVLDGLIQSRLVEQFALRRANVSQEEVASNLAQLKAGLQNQGVDYGQYLTSRGYTEETLQKRIQGGIAWRKYQEQQINEEKLRQYFTEHQNQFDNADFDQARPAVTQALSISLWNNAVRDMRQQSQIRTPSGPSAPNTQSQP